MKETYLESKGDLAWLAGAHGIPIKGIVCAVIVGNEDSPKEIRVYNSHYYKTEPIVYLQDEEGKMVKQP